MQPLSECWRSRCQTNSIEKHSHGGAGGAAGATGGILWFAGWLFTIGFVNLAWCKVILGLVVWPYFLGVDLK
jgi:hypothetical protein